MGGSSKCTFKFKSLNSFSIDLTLLICLGIIIVRRFLYFFFSIIWTKPQNFSSLKWVLDAHHDFLEWINLFKFSFNSELGLSDWLNYKLPRNFIFLAPSFFRYFFVSRFDDKQSLNLSNNDCAKDGKKSHLFNVFFVIRPFKRTMGIFFFDKLLIVFGHISESTKKTLDGFQ